MYAIGDVDAQMLYANPAAAARILDVSPAASAWLQVSSYTLLACNSILAFVRFFTVLAASGSTGVLVIIMIKMWNERTQAFLAMLIALGGSFAVAFTALSPATPQDATVAQFLEVAWLNFQDLFWALVADSKSEETSEGTNKAIFWIYLIVCQLLLANGVLIALLTDTYEAVRNRANLESAMVRFCC